MCYAQNKLFAVEQLGNVSYHLAVYRVTSGPWDDLTLLDAIVLERIWGKPRADPEGHVYIPSHDGVLVAQYIGNNLASNRTLKCVSDPWGVAVANSGEIYVSDWQRRSVYVVDVLSDTVVRMLHRPQQMEAETPSHLAVLGDSVLVCYGRNTLVVYHKGGVIADKLLTAPASLHAINSLCTDGQTHYVVGDETTGAVHVMSSSGKVLCTMQVPRHKQLRDIAVVNRQIWVSCYSGDIILLKDSHYP